MNRNLSLTHRILLALLLLATVTAVAVAATAAARLPAAHSMPDTRIALADHMRTRAPALTASPSSRVSCWRSKIGCRRARSSHSELRSRTAVAVTALSREVMGSGGGEEAPPPSMAESCRIGGRHAFCHKQKPRTLHLFRTRALACYITICMR